MAKEAERLLADSGWLPEPLRLTAQDAPAMQPDEGEEGNLPEFLAGDDEDDSVAADEVTAHAVAAE